MQKKSAKNEITSRQCNKFKLIEFQSKHNLSQQTGSGSGSRHRQQATGNTFASLKSEHMMRAKPRTMYYITSRSVGRQSVRRRSRAVALCERVGI